MAQDAKQFVDSWIDENVRPAGYEPEGDAAAARELAFACLRATDQAGYTRGAVEAACGDLVDYMAKAIERVNDEKVRRMIAQDKDS